MHFEGDRELVAQKICYAMVRCHQHYATLAVVTQLVAVGEQDTYTHNQEVCAQTNHVLC